LDFLQATVVFKEARTLLTDFYSTTDNCISPNSTWLITSRLDTTLHIRRVERVETMRVEPCCSTSPTQPKCVGSTRRTCRVVSRRDVTSQVEFWLYTAYLFSLSFPGT